MNRPPASSRAVPVAVLSVVAVLVALLTGGGATSASAHVDRQHADHGQHAAHHLTAQQVAFHDQMRKLWEDHVTWTRLAIVTFADDSPSFDATAGRLLQNQKDLGDAIKPFYGKKAGNQLTALLNEHILVAVELLQAAKAGDTAKVTDAAARWYANGNDIADFLAAANPRFWPKKAMRAGMKAHLDQTLAEAQHELSGDYAASVADYEIVHAHMLGMADTLSNGIMRTFPRRFR
jgi:hypothetical protein